MAYLLAVILTVEVVVVFGVVVVVFGVIVLVVSCLHSVLKEMENELIDAELKRTETRHRSHLSQKQDLIQKALTEARCKSSKPSIKIDACTLNTL